MCPVDAAVVPRDAQEHAMQTMTMTNEMTGAQVVVTQVRWVKEGRINRQGTATDADVRLAFGRPNPASGSDEAWGRLDGSKQWVPVK